MFDPSIADLIKQVADLKAGAADLTTPANVWTLVAGFLVLFIPQASRRAGSEHVFLVS